MGQKTGTSRNGKNVQRREMTTAFIDEYLSRGKNIYDHSREETKSMRAHSNQWQILVNGNDSARTHTRTKT